MRIILLIAALTVGSALFAQDFSLPEKKDKVLLKVDFTRPLLLGPEKQVALPDAELLYSSAGDAYASVLTRNVPVTSTVFFRHDRVLAVNCMIASLYQTAFGQRKPAFLNPSRTVLEVRDSSLVTFTGSTADKALTLERWNQWSKDHLYSYEIMLKDSTVNDAHSETVLGIMQRDLNAYFGKMGIEGKIEDRWVTVRELSWMPDAKKELSQSKGQAEHVERNALYYKQTNASIYTLTNLLNAYYWQLEKTPLTVSEAFGPDLKLDLELKAVMKDVASVTKALEKYGITITEKKQLLPMIVIIQK